MLHKFFLPLGADVPSHLSNVWLAYPFGSHAYILGVGKNPEMALKDALAFSERAGMAVDASQLTTRIHVRV